jgi:hypothetical protein
VIATAPADEGSNFDVALNGRVHGDFVTFVNHSAKVMLAGCFETNG